MSAASVKFIGMKSPACPRDSAKRGRCGFRKTTVSAGVLLGTAGAFAACGHSALAHGPRTGATGSSPLTGCAVIDDRAGEPLLAFARVALTVAVARETD